ncbi:DMT family transporter [Clostridium aestuarii]|uniref:DMT family transporter n=1 Tax=Clostridium aestuarii TaxID=338193 RepID=A0ABT4CVP7_9CLOT|nr:DMT family transporter [Clostridium aestuarii]MCY6483062.1 DMT family transporter [Clostridium aestuarii]
MLYIILALISGCLVILSMVINSYLAKKIGVFQGTFVNYTVGLLFTTLILVFKNEFANLSMSALSHIPFWAYLGGVIGVMVVVISNIIIPKIPAIYSTLLIFIGQLFTGLFIDHFTGNLISKGKIIGGFLIIAGLMYNFNVDKKQIAKNEQ